MQRTPLKIILAIFAPFYLNDILFIFFSSNIYPVLAIDYGSRLLVLAMLIYFLRLGNLFSNRELFLNKTSRQVFWVGSLILSAVGVASDRLFTCYLSPYFRFLKFFEYPDYSGEFLRNFDLSFGIALVAFSEEIMFRGLLCGWLASRGFGLPAVVLIQAIAFGTMHWSGGVDQMINATLWSIPPAIFTVRHRSIYPAMIAHYLTDLVAFF